MPAKNVSVDEFLSKRKAFVKGGGVLMKAAAAPPSWNAAKRSARFVMSSEAEDRDKDIIFQDGIDLQKFLLNPVALFAHNSRTWPIGTWDGLSKVSGRPKRTEGDLVFMPEGDDEDADRAARHVAAKTLRAVSIGFIPLTIRRRESEPDEWWPGYEIIECELVECSLVPVPANPDALVKDAGGDFTLARELIEQVIDTYVKLPGGVIVPRADYEKALETLRPAKTIVEVPQPFVTLGVDLATTDDVTAVAIVGKDGVVETVELVEQPADVKKGFLASIGDAFDKLFAKGAVTPPLPPELLGTDEPDAKLLAAAVADAELLNARLKSLV